VPAVRTAPMIGLAIQVVLLAILAATVDLGDAGWATGVAFGLITCAALIRGMHRWGAAAFGPANWVTLSRATLVGCVAALVADSIRHETPLALMITVAVVALALDALDGQVARRTGTAYEFGARFDMEVDAFLILVLSVYVASSTGAWALMIGAMRYAYFLAGWLLPWLRRPAPKRYWCKVVAAIQGIVLVTAAADVFPPPLIVTALVAALALLVESFGRDVVWLWQHRGEVDPSWSPTPRPAVVRVPSR
jgi:phosphatidylglycerophosphate synthase